MVFQIQIDHQIPIRSPDLVLINKKKRTCHLLDFVFPVSHKVKENEKTDKYLDLAWEPKNQWYMKVMVISIVVVALRTIREGLEKRLMESKIRERISTRVQLKWARIVRSIHETWRDLLLFRVQWKTTS